MKNETPKIDRISAQEVIIEVRDAQTGHLFRRHLPLEYYENDNGIRLIGENIDGSPAQIVLLSEKAIGKITDLTGHGADESRCDGHD